MSDEGRVRTSRDEWAKRVERWRDSGLSAAEFGAEVGVNPRTLTYWKWMLSREAAGLAAPRRRSRSAPKQAPNAAFVEIRSAAPSATFELMLANGRRLQIPMAFDASTLERLLAVLEQK